MLPCINHSVIYQQSAFQLTVLGNFLRHMINNLKFLKKQTVSYSPMCNLILRAREVLFRVQSDFLLSLIHVRYTKHYLL